MPQQGVWEDVGDWEDVTESPSTVISPVNKPVVTPEQPSLMSGLGKAWNAAVTPLTDAPSRFARSVAGLEQPTEGGIFDAVRAIPDIAKNIFSEPMATLKGMGQGMLEGVGNLATEQTSPLGIATTALPALRPVRKGLGSLASRILGKVDDVPTLPVSLAPKPVPTVSPVVSEAAEMAAPGPSVSPMFNPKGQTGMTGTAQAGPTTGTKITLKEAPSKEQIAELTSKGYVFDGLNEQGKFRFRLGPKAAEAPILETKPISKNAEPIIRRIKDKTPEEAGAIREAWNLSRGLMAVDLPFVTSAGLRQGLPLIGTKNWVKAWGPSIRAYGSTNFYNAHKALLEADPLMFRKTIPVMKADGTQLIKNGAPVLKEMPSIAEQAGVSLTDLGSLSAREESIRSKLAERIPVWGKVVAASNRSYAAYINDLRLNAFRNFYEAMPDKNNMVALRELGDAVNTFTGRGPLKTKIPFTGTPSTELNLEKYASGLSEALFAPKLMASRMQMLNPINYTMAVPQVRKEYLKAAIRTAGAWTTLASLGKLAGAEVTLNPTSADFGKMKFGDTRLDPAGGFQQFLVLASRLTTNEFTSSTTGSSYPLGEGYGAATRGSVTQDFLANKLHPSLKYFYDAAFARESRPFGVFDRALQLAIPMLSRDLMEIAKEQPELIPLLAPLTSAGMGTQHYTGQDFNAPMILPEEVDITLGR